MAKGFGVSPITNTIYFGAMNKDTREFTGKKVDVTKSVIRAVFEWFIGNMESEKCEVFTVTYPSSGYELIMRKKSAR